MIDEMLETAKKATPGLTCRESPRFDGAWYVEGKSTRSAEDWLVATVQGRDGPMNEANAAHIVTCSPERIIALCEFAKAFTAWHDHKDAYSHTYETAYTEMVMAWRKLL